MHWICIELSFQHLVILLGLGAWLSHFELLSPAPPGWFNGSGRYSSAVTRKRCRLPRGMPAGEVTKMEPTLPTLVRSPSFQGRNKRFVARRTCSKGIFCNSSMGPTMVKAPRLGGSTAINAFIIHYCYYLLLSVTICYYINQSFPNDQVSGSHETTKWDGTSRRFRSVCQTPPPFWPLKDQWVAPDSMEKKHIESCKKPKSLYISISQLHSSDHLFCPNGSKWF